MKDKIGRGQTAALQWFPDSPEFYDVIKEAYWSVGQKIDFVMSEKWDNLTFKATIQAISDYTYSLDLFSLYSTWVTDFDITDISEESLELEPVYVLKAEKSIILSIGNRELKINKGEIFTISETFLNQALTKEAVDEYFGYYIEVKMETYNNEDYSESKDIERDILEFLESKGLSPIVRKLQEYEEEDVRSVMQSLYYYLDIQKDEKTRIAVINLLRGATKKEVFTNPKNRKYEVLIDTVEPRTIIAYALNTVNRKKYTFKY